MPEDTQVVDLDTVLNDSSSSDVDSSVDDSVDSTEVDSVDTDTDVDADNESDLDGDVDVELDGEKKESGKPSKFKLSKTDFDKLPKKYKDLFKSDPELRAVYNVARELGSHFESPKEAIALKESIESLGGVEAIKQELHELSTADAMLMEGNPAVLEELVRVSPEGFSKLIPSAIGLFAKSDPEGFRHMTDSIVASSFQRNGVAKYVEQIYNRVDPNSEAGQMIASFYNNYIIPRYEGSQQAPVKKENPEQLKLQKEREEFESKKKSDFVDSITSEGNNYLSSQITRGIGDLFKGKRIPEDTKEMLTKNVIARFTKLINADPNYNKQANQLIFSGYESGDRSKAVKYLKAKVDDLMDTAIKQTWRAWNGSSATATKVASNSNTSKSKTPQITKVNKYPMPSSIDKVATEKFVKERFGKNWDWAVNNGYAVLKNGKIVQA